MSASKRLRTALAEQRRLATLAIEQENRILRESLELYAGVVDPSEAYRERNEFWEPVESRSFRETGPLNSEHELSAARAACRHLAATNEFAINGHENRISYLVGAGHRYRVVARPRHHLTDAELRAAQEVIDDFIRHNRWHRRQQELVRRCDRDGEAFLRFFAEPGGRLRVRFVEPWQVRSPERIQHPHAQFGIQTTADDVETVEGYWIDGQLVDASEVQHRKANVDGNARRGIPLFYPVRRNLVRAEKLLRNMAAVSDIQTAIALIRRHHTARQASLERLRGHLASATVHDRSTGQTEYLQPYQPGTILDVHGDTEYDFPAQGLDAGRYVAVLQAILRAVASRLCMPEYMLTSDASNASYSSTLIAESPAVKMFQRLQHELMEDDREVFARVLQTASDAGYLPADVPGRVELQIEPPSVAVRNALEEAQVDEILVRNGAMSVATMALRHGLDPAKELSLPSERHLQPSRTGQQPLRGETSGGSATQAAGN